MGKRIIQQRRGRGSFKYRRKKRAFRNKMRYPREEGKGKVIDIINSPAHTAPLAKIKVGKEIFYIPALNNLIKGQEIEIGEKIEKGNIVKLEKIPSGTRIFNIESRPGDGGKLIRTAGNSAIVTKKEKGRVAVLLPSKKEKWLDKNCRATIGVIAGQGRLEKPIVKAGKKYYIMKAKGKLYPKTSPVKMNAVDHPFGSGRGRNVSHGRKGKIPKKNAPAGAKVGTLRPKRTGRKKK